MNFLEAHAILSEFSGGETLHFLFALSGSASQFELYLKASAAKAGRTAEVRTLPFNTLAQALMLERDPKESEVFLLVPWDFVPEADWRSGLPLDSVNMSELQGRASSVGRLLAQRLGAKFLYLPGPIPPLFSDPAQNTQLKNLLNDLAASIGACVLSSEFFSLTSYFANGCPIGGRFIGEVAVAAIRLALPPPKESSKILVTDLDQSLWCGVVAEDGLDGIHFAPEGRGYKHFLYQSFLARLKRQGSLLAAISRNDSQVALEPLRSRRMILHEEDFVCVVCSYHAKSAQIIEIAKRLNLGLESFVFVDDNPVELAEVSTQLPQVRCLAFPPHDDGLPEFLEELSRLFAKKVITPEDRDRTELYRRRLEGLVPADLEGADVSSFLRGLQMKLSVAVHSHGTFERAVQLINKTNQFNLNGRRVTAEEIAAALATGARLYGARLSDRSGSHGEILACLLLPDGIISSFVMSCRVFQRRVEYAFLAWLCSQADPPRGLDFLPTSRNDPFRSFLQDPAFRRSGSEIVHFDAARFANAHAADLALFAFQGSDND
jgi:FkbH-like protein